TGEVRRFGQADVIFLRWSRRGALPMLLTRLGEASVDGSATPQSFCWGRISVLGSHGILTYSGYRPQARKSGPPVTGTPAPTARRERCSPMGQSATIGLSASVT